MHRSDAFKVSYNLQLRDIIRSSSLFPNTRFISKLVKEIVWWTTTFCLKMNRTIYESIRYYTFFYRA